MITESPSTAEAEKHTQVIDYRLRLPGLAEHREDVSKRRATAFCDAPEYVMGTEVLPLTPRTFSMLIATGSKFVVGGIPREADVRNYLWFHSRLYADCGNPGWPKMKKKALRRFSMLLLKPWRKWVGLKSDKNNYFAALAIAIAEIKKLVEDGFSDAVKATDLGKSQLATIEAYLIHEFSSAYGWAPEKTRNMPLGRLFQLHRCIRASRGEEVYDEGERMMLYEHLRSKNEKLKNERETP